MQITIGVFTGIALGISDRHSWQEFKLNGASTKGPLMHVWAPWIAVAAGLISMGLVQ